MSFRAQKIVATVHARLTVDFVVPREDEYLGERSEPACRERVRKRLWCRLSFASELLWSELESLLFEIVKRQEAVERRVVCPVSARIAQQFTNPRVSLYVHVSRAKHFRYFSPYVPEQHRRIAREF